MSFFDDYLLEGDYTTYGQMQGHSSDQTTISCYPGPPSANLQSLPSYEPTSFDQQFSDWPFSLNDGFQFQAPYANEDHHLFELMQNEQLPLESSLDVGYDQSLYEATPHPFDTELWYQTVLSSTHMSDDDAALEAAIISPNPRKRKFSSNDSGQDANRLRSSKKLVPQAQSLENTPEPSTLPTQRLGPSESPSSATLLLAGGSSQPAKRRLQKASTMVKMKDGVLHAWVDNEWKRAGYHVHHRERLIREDAWMSGALVLQKGMGLNITSHSPLTHNWTDDPKTVVDRQGRQVLFLSTPPEGWVHNPKCGFLCFDGLVLLGQDHMPIKRYDGAPLTISSRPPPWLVEGLRRVFGMTIEDIKARIDLRRNYPSGMRLLGYSYFTNSLGQYMQENKPLGMVPWFHRKKRKGLAKDAGFPTQDPWKPPLTNTI